MVWNGWYLVALKKTKREKMAYDLELPTQEKGRGEKTPYSDLKRKSRHERSEISAVNFSVNHLIN